MLKRVSNVLQYFRELSNGLVFFLRTGTTEDELLGLYVQLARLDYREPQIFKLDTKKTFSISTMRGGPRINTGGGYEFLLKYSNENRQLYIQEYSGGVWTEVYRTGHSIRVGYWLVVLKALLRHNPCVPHREEGFV